MTSSADLLARFGTRADSLVAHEFGFEPVGPGVERVAGFFPEGFVALQTHRQGGGSSGPYSTFNLGDHVGDDPVVVDTNRRQLAAHVAGSIPWLRQVHGTRVTLVESALTTECEADGALTDQVGQPCVVMTADCLPLLVARPSTGQCAAIHAGWRGLCEGVIESGLKRMAEQPAPPGATDDWYVWIGPAIGPDAFEVGDEVRQAFADRDPISLEAFSAATNRPGKWHADLAGLAVGRIAAWACAAKTSPRIRIAAAPDCVFSNSQRYFSYRRDGRTGRMASLIYRAS